MREIKNEILEKDKFCVYVIEALNDADLLLEYNEGRLQKIKVSQDLFDEDEEVEIYSSISEMCRAGYRKKEIKKVEEILQRVA